jgi:hypothetical protein
MKSIKLIHYREDVSVCPNAVSSRELCLSSVAFDGTDDPHLRIDFGPYWSDITFTSYEARRMRRAGHVARMVENFGR